MKLAQPQWFCIRTKPEREINARLELIGLGFDVYLPLKVMSIRRRKAHGMRRPAKSVMVAAKERLLFVKGPLKLNILSTAHEIEDILCYKGEPVSVGDGVIDAWRENERMGLTNEGRFYAGDEFTFLSLLTVPKIA